MNRRAAGIISLVLAPFLFGFKFVSEIQNEHGNRLYKKGQVAKAGAAYENALRSDPAAPGVALNRGNAYYKEGRMDKALESYKRAAESDRDPSLQSAAFYNLGDALVRRGDLARAEDFYKQSLRLNPKDQDAKYNLEFLLKHKDQKKDRQKKDDPKKDEPKKDDQKNQENQNQTPPESKEESQAPEEKKAEEKKAEPKKTEAQVRAEQILNALENQEKQVLKSKGGQKNPRSPYRRVNEKDW